MKFEKLLKKDIYEINKILNKKNNILIDCKSSGLKQVLMQNLNNFIFYVAENKLEAKNITQQLKSMSLRNVDLLEANQNILSSKTDLIRNINKKQIVTLTKMLNKKTEICVTYPEALANKYPISNVLKDNILNFYTSTKVDIKKITNKLINIGYERVNKEIETGQFILKGDVLTIAPINEESIFVISFFDDYIEKIKKTTTDKLFQANNVTKFSVAPNEFYLIDDINIEALRSKIKNTVLETSEARENLSEVSKEFIKGYISKSQTAGEWLSVFSDKFNSIFDYIDKDGIIVFDDYSSCIRTLENLEINNKNRIVKSMVSGYLMKDHLKAYVSKQEIMDVVKKRRTIDFDYKFKNYDYRLETVPLKKYFFDYPSLISDIRRSVDINSFLYIFSSNIHTAKRLQKSLEQEEIFIPIAENENIQKQSIVPFGYEKGFYYKDHLIIGLSDYLGNRGSKFKTNRNALKNIPEIGDYVVHQLYGIGICVGLSKQKHEGVKKDYINIEYRDKAMLYMPSDQIYKLQKYLGSEQNPQLSKLGGDRFNKIKKAAKKAIKEMAFDLLELYAKRERKAGFNYSKDSIKMKELEENFEFEETKDQLKAIASIKDDMETGRVMDRLLCGDVGYGKTEVALRAIFKTIDDGKQALFISPTTILASQHFETLSKRFIPLGHKVELVTRFKNKKQITETLKRLRTGETLCVVGTHRLLSKDVMPKDLGLVVIDEEQRFGVEQKEKIKTIKGEVNYLELSATPIPRTLHMSLSGIRDISVLETPPNNRIPIQTYVCDYSEETLKLAVENEIARNGQVFILYNRVETIEKFANSCREILPKANIIVAHGQMSKTALENAIDGFYSKKYNVLICSTIIENGIDIPDANTLIVCNSDRLGLASLYQIRGRVGRSETLAYAYFTVDPSKKTSADSQKRLKALLEYQELGSGYKIAMRDLEIRGSGNIIGKQQHGHMLNVGYEMYMQMLDEQIQIMLGYKRDKLEIEFDIKVDTYFKAKTNSKELNDNEMLKLYKNISTISNKTDKIKVEMEALSMFEKISQPLQNLIDVAYIKCLFDNINNNLTASILKVEINNCDIKIFVDSVDILKEHILEDFFKKTFKKLKIGSIADNSMCLNYILNKETILFKIIDVLEKIEEKIQSII